MKTSLIAMICAAVVASGTAYAAPKQSQQRIKPTPHLCAIDIPSDLQQDCRAITNVMYQFPDFAKQMSNELPYITIYQSMQNTADNKLVVLTSTVAIEIIPYWQSSNGVITVTVGDRYKTPRLVATHVEVKSYGEVFTRDNRADALQAAVVNAIARSVRQEFTIIDGRVPDMMQQVAPRASDFPVVQDSPDY